MTSDIWEYLFKGESLAVRLPEISDGLPLKSNKWGNIKVAAHIATAFGDNFTSDAYAVKATEEDGTEHKAFVKVFPRSPMLFVGAMSQGLYLREIAIYNCLHAQLMRIREEAGVSDSALTLNVPQHYFSIMDEEGPCGANKTAIILEDMKSLGFKTVDKRFGNSAKEAALVVRALARYHALTIALINKKWRTSQGIVEPPETLEFTKHSIQFHEKNYDMVGVSIDVCVRMARERLGTEAAVWLENEYNCNGEKALKPESIDACEPLLCVLHADCWSNNMMFRYDEHGDPIDVCIVDWQITRIGHPATDLIQYLFTSTTSETRKDHLNSLVENYYTTLESALAALGCNILKETQYGRSHFLKDVHQRLRFGLFMSFVVFPAILDDSLFRAIAASRAQKPPEGSNTEAAHVFNTAEIKKYISVDKMLSNELLYNRIVETVAEVKSLIEKQTL